MTRRWSLQARLLVLGAVTGLVALAFAAVAIGGVLERFVTRGLDQTLDTQIVVLRRAIDADGALDRRKVIELPGFDDPAGGWSWRVSGPAGAWRSGAPTTSDPRPPRDDDHHHGRSRDRPRPAEGRTAEGDRVHLRVVQVPLANGGQVEIAVGAPRQLVERPLRAALGTLLGALALLALGLAAATVVQLRVGLRPVRALRDAVARVRTGAAAALPEDQPAELRPLAAEVNALIEQNRAGLEHARQHVANLAHGLKTPLATLSARLAREGASGESRALVDELDRRIAHHLRRARAAAPAAGGRARTDLAEVVPGLIDAMRHIHVERALTIAGEGVGTVAMDRHDLEEVLGNLLDNACRHAAGRVTVTARDDSTATVITIEDDGHGMTDDQIAHAMKAGVRLDESGTGYGFGLGIARELVELYGGALTLGRSALGGLAASVRLPRG